MGADTAQIFHFGDFTLDQSRYRLQRGERIVPLERRPMELLFLLIEKRGELVSREEVADRLWGTDVFVDIDQGINTAVRKVRRVLRDDPEKPRYIETIVGKGYRFAAPVTCNGEISTPEFSAEQESVPPPVQGSATEIMPTAGKRALFQRTKLLLIAVSALALAAAGWWLDRSRSHPGNPQSAIKSLAVLPLKNITGDPAQEYLAEGMTEELIGRLSGIHDLRVISRTSVMRFKDTQLSAPEISKMLGADALMEGSVIREGNRIRIHAQLIRGATDEHFWSESYDGDLGDALALDSQVAQSIARKVEVTITGKERERLVTAHHVAPEVYESYLKGEFIQGFRRADVEKRIAYFEEAISKDSMFAPAYLGLAEAYGDLGSSFVGGSINEVRPKVISAARKALELDPQLAEAYALLAEVEQDQWQWAEAEAEYKRALDLNPNDAAAHIGLANWLLCQGRIDEALTWAQRARELDPLGISGVQTGWILLFARRYDDAIRELQSVLAVHPDYDLALWALGSALISKGQYKDAIPVFERMVTLMERSPGTIDSLATAYAYAGRRTDALRLINELKQRRKTSYVSAGAFIDPYLALGDYDEAFAWFERAYQEKSESLQYLKVSPLFDPVRKDPRFKDLVRRVGLGG